MASRIVTHGDLSFSIEDLPSRAGIRFAVGSPTGRRSSTWRLWGDKKGDVYLSMRSQGGRLKASFHRDRKCSVGFTEEYAETARAQFGTQSRHWERWVLPEGEVVRIAQIVIPESDLALFTANDSAQMRWLPCPKPGNAVIISIFIAEPPEAFNWESPEKNGHMIGIMQTSKRFTWAVYNEQALDEKTIKHFEESRIKALQLSNNIDITSYEPGTRLALWGHCETPADMYFVELAVN